MKVSIITPVYNSEKFLRETIDSVIAQTFEDWEMILIDDRSTDNSWGIIDECRVKDHRIKSYKLNKNSGAGVARNKAIRLAKGRFIAFLDSDDMWHPEKLQKQLDFMQSNNFAFSFTSYRQIDEEGNEIRIIKSKKRVTYKEALFDNPIGCLSAMYDAEVLGKQYMPTIRKRQDYALWLKILKLTTAHGLNEVLAYYRVRKDSISSNKVNLIKYQWRLYREIEGFSKIKSLFYLLNVVINKIIKN
ncbi:glycosyltransferase family 2 protein [Aquimarina sp. U1-2]|uniref:glycosyltransferase family 2 protein n=1 Tax=Aquimarina sp. U1-2 TaxID=2823141 RepID=UPI001AEC7CB8|nr:glycosyltransferase family 2 protein [Aquimarina sp. U1-2]MBP2833267.1 glycosyltransferase family 2 protein [Aquimarina sp. U1-2]